MILADTSIVVEFLRTADPKLRRLIVNSPAAICGVTRAEVLHGSRDPAHRHQLLTALNMFAHLTIPETLWDRVGDHLATLRSAGVTVPFADALIATVAIENGIALWTRDSHFATIQNTLPPFHCLLSRRKAGRSLPGRVCSSDSEPRYGHPVGAPWE